jgi:hypothetical protein
MIAIASVLVGGWLLLAAAGYATLSTVPRSVRDTLFPALPAVGALVLVVLLHATGIVLPAEIGLAIIGVAVVVGLLVWRRRRAVWAVSRAAVVRLAIVTALGIVPLTLAIVPVLRAGDPVTVMPGTNHDAFAYVSVATWYQHHAITSDPGRTDLPGYGYVRNHQKNSLRVGEDLVQAAVATVTGRPPIDTVSTVIGLFVFLLPGACAAATTLFRRSWLAGAVAGTLIGVSAVTADQVFMQNAASVFGIALAGLAIAAAIVAEPVVRRRARTADGRPQGSRLPLWLGAVGLAGLAGSYSEYLTIIAPTLVLYVLIRSRNELRQVVPRAAALAGLALVIAPLAWIRAVGSLSKQGGLGNRGESSAFLDVPARVIAARITGLASLTDTAVDGRTLVASIAIIAAVVAGVGLAIALDRRRRLWIILPAVSGLVVAYLSSGDRDKYSQQRAVELAMPLLVLVAAVGYAAARERLERVRVPRRAGRELIPATAVIAIVAVVLGALGVVAFANVQTANATPYVRDPVLASRTVDSTFGQAAGWVDDVGRPDGSNVAVLSRQFFDQLWIAFDLRHESAIEYPFLYPDYLGTKSPHRFDGNLPRFVLVDTDVYVDADPGTEVRHNERFRLYDLSRGQALFAMPTTGWQAGTPSPDGLSTWMIDDGSLLVMRSAGVPDAMTLIGHALPALDPLPMSVAVNGGQPGAPVTVGAGSSKVPASLPPGAPSATLLLHNGKPAQPPGGADQRDLSFELDEVTRG